MKSVCLAENTTWASDEQPGHGLNAIKRKKWCRKEPFVNYYFALLGPLQSLLSDLGRKSIGIIA